MDVKLIFLGKPQVFYNGIPLDIRVKKAVALLAYLATTAKAHSRERLATFFWPDSKEDVARTSLRQITQTLRTTPLAAALLINRDTIELHPDITSDVQTFLALARQIDTMQTHFSVEEIARLQSAERLYQGDFLEDFDVLGSAEWEDWQHFRRIEFQYQATCIIAALARYYAQQGLADSGLKMVARWLDMDPYNDEAHYLTMHFYMLNNQTERALEQYHLWVRLLERENEQDPNSKVHDLYEQIRRGRYIPATHHAASNRPIRTLLPRPIPKTTILMQEYASIQSILKGIGERPAFLIVIYDEQKQAAPGLIATIAHDPEIQMQFPDGILWASFNTNDDFEALLRLWLDAMRISILKSTSKIEHLVWQFHNGQRNKRLLFLLENVPDARSAQHLMPGYVGCTLIITTIHRHVALELAQHTDYIIGLPSPTRAADGLFRINSNSNSSES